MKNTDLYKNNYDELWMPTERDTLKWNTGRIAVMKMNILLRLMFFFQTILRTTETKQYDAWQKKLSKFVWAGKKPRIKTKFCVMLKKGEVYSS